ncbi:Xylose operon regulatory protein [Sedimentisphaera salicampi]|uniref:Xylose operon regulatory protein n=2 Tax=Sedimentisphaera salicampi TaxID=1941349 RepID=A0A1W6LQD7_9BACT|nr:Xylose operon regulatory protein [Sedimentisphaera salicampi]OXU14154.1 Xylose operon regulatory protein [Sedimentisphaera salicampi]
MEIPKVILLVENSRAFGRNILRGIARYSATNGPWSFFRPEAFYLHPGKAAIPELEFIKKVGADGIIMRETPNTEKILSLGIPTILSSYLQKEYTGAVQVLNDNEKIGSMGAEHLINKGFKNFAFCGNRKFFWSNERREGFINRAEKAKLQSVFVKEKYKNTKRSNQHEIIRELNEWITTLPLPIGIMTCTDEYAQYIAEAAKISELRIPEDVAVLGVDNDDFICDLTYPTLSSIELSAEQAGFECAANLDILMKNPEYSKGEIIVNPLYIKERHSTNILAANIPEIVASLKFIENNIEERISVQDVADYVCISRRSLERLFANQLQRSVFEMIKEMRLARIIKYLSNTELSAGEISRIIGFSEEASLSKFFRKEKGISLRKFRKLINSNKF